MGRKIVRRIMLFLAVLAMLYFYQDSFAQHVDGEGEEQEDPLVLYRVEYQQLEEGKLYYTVPPTVKIIHPGKSGETCFFLQSDDTKKEGCLNEEGSVAVLMPEDFQEGNNFLEIWMEYEGEKIRHQQIEFKIDTKAPKMEVQIPQEGWCQKEVCVDISAEDGALGSGVKNIACYVNGKEIENIDGGKASFWIQDCSYEGKAVEVSIVAWDYAGNREKWEGGVFIDAVRPTVEIKGVTDYMITNREVEAVFTASDENVLKKAEVYIVKTDIEGKESLCQKGEWSVENGKKTYREKLAEEGKYEMEVYAEDMAGFTATAKAQIIIDKQAPVISHVNEFDGVYMQEFCWDYSVLEFLQDFTSCSYNVTLDGKFYAPGQSLRKEGKHQLRIEAVDQADNRSEKRVDFTIDHTAPEIIINGITDGKAYEQRAKFDIYIAGEKDWITEIKISGREIVLPEKCRKYSVEIKEIGIHEIEICAEDEAKNKATKIAMIEIVPEETIIQKILKPVQKSLGLEEERFQQEENETGGSHADGIKNFLFTVPGVLGVGIAGVYGIRRRRNIIHK